MNGAVPPIGLNGAVPPIGLNGAGPLGALPGAGTLVAKLNEKAKFKFPLLSENAPAGTLTVNAAFAAKILAGVKVAVVDEIVTPDATSNVVEDPPVCARVMLPVPAEMPSEKTIEIERGPLPALLSTANVVIPLGGSDIINAGFTVSTPVVNTYVESR